jgi:type II secretion system protein N
MATRTIRLRDRIASLVPTGVSKRALVGYAAWTIGAFVVFWIATFPHELAARRLATELVIRSGWRIDFDSVAFRPWEGYRFSAVRARRGSAGAPVEASRISLRPGLRDLLFRGRTTLLVDGEAYGGSFDALVASRDDGGFELELDEIELGEIPTLREVADGRWEGRVSGRLRIHARGDVTNASGEGTLALVDGALSAAMAGGFKIPDVRFSRGDVEFVLENGRLELRRAAFAGPDLDASIGRRIHLRTPADRSLLDLQIEIRPAPGSQSGLEPLLQLWNRNQRPPDGRYRIALGGTLGSPRLR